MNGFDFLALIPTLRDSLSSGSSPFLQTLPQRDRLSLLDSAPFFPDRLIQLFLGPDLELNTQREGGGIRINHQDKTIHFFARSVHESALCPHCHTESRSIKNRKCSSHNPQHLPIHGFTTFIHIDKKSFRCKNPECRASSFTESIRGYRQGQHRSDTLNEMILSVSLHTSDNAASITLKESGIQVSHDSIGDLLSRIEIEDDPHITAVGIDDTAIRKGQSYCTVIYDQQDHHLVALLKGRDGDELRKWLRAHPEVKTVCRDRDSAYARAVREECGDDCIQTADRFHLFQNLMGYLKDEMKYKLPSVFYAYKGNLVPNIKEVTRQISALKGSFPPESLRSADFDNSPVLDENGDEIKFIQTITSVDLKAAQQKAQETRCMAVRIRKRWQEASAEAEKSGLRYTRTDLASEFRISYQKVCSYIRMTDSEAEALGTVKQRKSRTSCMDSYKNMIYKALRAGWSALKTAHYVVSRGCRAAHSTIAVWVTAISNHNFGTAVDSRELLIWKYPPETEEISRQELLKYITIKDRKKMAGQAVARQFEKIKEMYPHAAWADEVWTKFHEIIMGDDPDALDNFLERYEDSAIQPFVNGIKKDIAPVRNAISFPHSSGFVEGGNTRFKTVKRIGFGRSKLDHLFRKTYAVSIIMRTGMSVSQLLNKWFCS